MTTDDAVREIDPTVAPSGTGCAECLAQPDGWWVHLRRCAACGQIGCCESSPAQHATAHFRATGHPIVQSYEPGEEWGWDYRVDRYVKDLTLAPPTSRPADQGSPAPADRVPPNWLDLIRR